MQDITSSDIYNLGSGVGTSIIKLLDIFKETIEIPFRYRIHPRRSSDITSIILESSKLLESFPGFTFQKLEEKIPVTWNYFKTQQKKTCPRLSA